MCRLPVIIAFTAILPTSAAFSAPVGLRYEGKAAWQWAIELRANRSKTKNQAFEGLVSGGEIAVPVLLRLYREYPSVRSETRAAFRRIAEHDPGLVRRFLRRLGRRYFDPLATGILEAMGHPGGVPALLDDLDARDRDVREGACLFLASRARRHPAELLRIGERLAVATKAHPDSCRPTLDAIADALKSGRVHDVSILREALKVPGLRLAVWREVLRTHEPAPDLVPAFLGALKESDDPDEIRTLLRLLPVIGVDRGKAVEIVTKLGKGDDYAVRCAAFSALATLGKPGLDRLGQLLSTEKTERCAEILTALSDGEKAAVPLLARALQETRARLRSAAAMSLGRIGESAASAVPALLSLLEHDPALEVRVKVALALGDVAGENVHVARALALAAQNDPDYRVQAAAIKALGTMKRRLEREEAFARAKGRGQKMSPSTH